MYKVLALFIIFLENNLIMAKYYVCFSSTGNPTDENKCTTKWPDDVRCSIPIGGILNIDGNDTFYNLMVMESDYETQIQSWIAANSGKVELITKDQADALGRAFIVPGTENIVVDSQTGTETVMVAGLFDIEAPAAVWSAKFPVVVEVIPVVETPVVDEVIEVITPVVVEVIPVVETPVVDEVIEVITPVTDEVISVVETPVVETPVADEVIEVIPVVETPVVDEVIEVIPVVETPVVEEVIAPVVETPVVEESFVETPEAPVEEDEVIETPVVETPVTEEVIETPVV